MKLKQNERKKKIIPNRLNLENYTEGVEFTVEVKNRFKVLTFGLPRGGWYPPPKVFSMSTPVSEVMDPLVMREALDGFEGGVQIGGRRVTNLRYADDIILLAASESK